MAVGQSVQGAVDSLADKGGGVVLESGVYQLPAALRIGSNVTLAGQGNATILWLDPKVTGPAVTAAKPGVHDVKLRDLVIEGATSVRSGTDPNADRRRRTRRDAPRRAGISVQSDSNRPIRRLRLEHVTVRDCTDDGLEIGNAEGVVIDSCSFTDNGNKSADRPVPPNDLSLIGVTDCQIASTRINNSPDGDGASVRDGRDITFSGNEIARSVLWGIEITRSKGIHVTGNLIEGDEAGPLHFDEANSGASPAEVRDNRVQYNGPGGGNPLP